MFNRTISVIKNRNKYEKEEKARRNAQEKEERVFEAYRAKLYENMKSVELILTDKSVSSVTIEIPEEYKVMFLKLIYEEEMQEYSIVQIDENRFSIGRKLINF